MTAIAVACLPIFFTGNVISRWEGGLFLVHYVAYTLYLILGTQNHHSLALYSSVMMWFAIPITVLTLGVVAAREYRRCKRLAH